MNSDITRVAARVITPLATVVAAYLLLRGHSSLGGGFMASVVVGIAAVFRVVTIGAQAVDRAIERGVPVLIGVGLLLMLANGFLGYWWGHGFLAGATASVHLPVVGELHVSSTLLFELGVAVVVLAVVVAVIDELGGERP